MPVREPSKRCKSLPLLGRQEIVSKPRRNGEQRPYATDGGKTPMRTSYFIEMGYSGFDKFHGSKLYTLLVIPISSTRTNSRTRNRPPYPLDHVLQMCYICALTMRLREHLVLRIDSATRKALERIAKAEDDSVARVIRRAISEFLKRRGGK